MPISAWASAWNRWSSGFSCWFFFVQSLAFVKPLPRLARLILPPAGHRQEKPIVGIPTLV